jgi:PAS domain S-box-containing protein
MMQYGESSLMTKWYFYRNFVVLGIFVVFFILFLAYRFVFALKENQVSFVQQTLDKQVELAAKQIQEEFHSSHEDLIYYAENINPGLYKDLSAPESLFEQRTRRTFNSHRNILDTIIVKLPNGVVSFSFDNQNSFRKEVFQDLIGIPGNDTNEILYTNESRNIEVIFKLNINRFLNDVLSSYYLGQTGKKLVMMNGSFAGIIDPSSAEYYFLEDIVNNQILSDMSDGLKGSYIGNFIDNLKTEKYQATIHQYPIIFSPLQDSYTIVFLDNISKITPSLLGTHFYMLLVFLLIILFVIIILYKSIKNAQNANQVLSKNSAEIEELFRRQTLLLQESKGFIYLQDRDSQMKSVSEEVVNILGYSPSDFCSNFKNYIVGSDRDLLEKLIKETLEKKGNTLSMEVNIIHASGEIIRGKLFERYLYDEVTGAFAGNVGICTDITQKYLAENEVIKSENRLRAVLKSLPDIIFTYDIDGIITDFYVEDEELLYQPAHDYLGKTILEVLPAPLNFTFMEAFQQAVVTPKMITIEYELTLQTGTRIYETRIFRLDDDRMISIGRDITGQRLWEKGMEEAIEAAQQASKAKSEFLAIMSHEIRTPMNGLLGLINLMSKTNLDEQQQEYLQIIRDSGHSLSKIINDILDYSKIESGMMSVNTSVFDFKKEIDRTLKILSGLTENKNIQLTHKLGPFIPEFVELDKEKLEQILLNIIGNAIKFTPNGGSVLVLTFGEPIFEDHIILHFTIIDSGIGIPSEMINRLTEPFVQVDESNTREQSGSGLGLAISKRLIELMGGELTIESKVGEGSEISFSVFGEVKLKQDEFNLLNLDDQANDFDWKNMADNYPLKILLVEDNETNIKFMNLVMEELGYQVTIAKNGFEALDQVALKNFDLILMDVQMPKLDGLETTRRIRSNPQIKPVIILGLSANAFQEDVKNALEAGMDGYITKPVDIQQLARSFKKVSEEKFKNKGVA